MRTTASLRISLGTCATLLAILVLRAGELPRTGPATEKRFPPLRVPAGFKATLFACDPLIEYPSVICAGPRPGAVFVAVDYLTGLGTEIVRRDEVRLVEDTDGDGYADKATVYAKGLNSVQGLAYQDGTLYVMHAPFLTALRDTTGSGTADERRDLLSGLGLPPEKNRTRLHCANGVVPGHDGWLYLALGDNGIDVPRPEGDRLVLRGGGILRCRPDGRDLHVFATGLRNIYDVALDAGLNVFVRDNENDGGAYKIRLCHSFFGADHGYPYLYEEHPGEALPPLAELGLGSSAGGLCYLEQQFPLEYRGDLFFCEWGRSVVRYQPGRAGSAFGPAQETEFAAGAADDPYGFKPTDLLVQRDGTLMISDWADGQQPRRGRGRIYRVAHAGVGTAKERAGTKANPGIPPGLAPLDSPSQFQRRDAQTALERRGREVLKVLNDALARERLGPRGRLHTVWVIARVRGLEGIDDLLRIAQTDPDPDVRAQAVRAVADLADPVLREHKLDAGPGDPELAGRLAGLSKGQDPRVMLEIVIALGRLRWAGAADWLRRNLPSPDPVLAHAAMQTLRRCGNWPAVLKLLDLPENEPVRGIALRAVAERFEPAVVDGLIERSGKSEPTRRQEYAAALARVFKKPGPWTYWGYRPAPRPANTVAWERTDGIEKALDGSLADPDRGVRLHALRQMQRENVPVRVATLSSWLRDEHQPERVATILAAMRGQPVGETRRTLDAVVRDQQHSAANRKEALALLVAAWEKTAGESLLELAKTLEDGPVLADALRRLAAHPHVPAGALLMKKVKSPETEVRAAAAEAVGQFRLNAGREAILGLLRDREGPVRRAAAAAAGKLGERRAIESLLKLAAEPDVEVRRASLDSLRRLQEPRAVPLAVTALNDRRLELTAVQCLAELGGPDQAAAVADLARRSPSGEVAAAVVRALSEWRDRSGRTAAQRQALDRTVAEVQGNTGIVIRWNVRGPLSAEDAGTVIADFVSARPTAGGKTMFAGGTEGRVVLATKGTGKDGLWLAAADVAASEQIPVEFLVSSGGGLRVWLNDKETFRRDRGAGLRADSDRFASTLVKGKNRLLVQVGPSPAAVEFYLRFRRKSAKAEHEQLMRTALSRPGNAERGRQLFLNVEKSQCLKCHRLGDRGEQIGPELTGIGSRFARVYIVESILEPSRTIAPSFGTRVVALKSGKVLSGVAVGETVTTLTLADSQGQKHVLMKADIDVQQTSPVSTMPEGLEKLFTEAEFVDLVAFLTRQKQGQAAK